MECKKCGGEMLTTNIARDGGERVFRGYCPKCQRIRFVEGEELAKIEIKT